MKMTVVGSLALVALSSTLVFGQTAPSKNNDDLTTPEQLDAVIRKAEQIKIQTQELNETVRKLKQGAGIDCGWILGNILYDECWGLLRRLAEDKEVVKALIELNRRGLKVVVGYEGFNFVRVRINPRGELLISINAKASDVKDFLRRR